MLARLLAATLIGLMCSVPAFAQGAEPSAQARTGQVRVVLDEPANEKHRQIRAMMLERQIPQAVQALLGPFRLPRELTILVKSCEGREGAFYDNGVAAFCYEYAELIERHAPKVATPWGVSRADAIVGGILDTILHEAGHGVFEILEIPVFGREEDAADFFSVYLQLQFPDESAKRLIQGVAYMMGSEARADFAGALKPFALSGAHSMNAQRYYNVLCLAYGANPDLVGSAVPPGMSPWRAGTCGDEYAMLKRAFVKLILPHVDEAKLREGIAGLRFNWGELATAREKFDSVPIGAEVAAEDARVGRGAASR